MTNSPRIFSALATAAFVVAVGFSASVHQPKAAADPPVTVAQTKALFDEKCSACHDAPDPVAHGFTKPQWQSTVNRMLTAHGASTSISTVQAAEIVDYLGQFAPAPNSGNNNEIGEWEEDPVISASYPFTYPPTLQNFDIDGGGWRVIAASDTVSGYLKHVSTGDGPALLMENKHTIQGALDLEVQFHVNQSSPNTDIGLLFGATDPKNYLSVVYAPSAGTVTLNKVTAGQPAVLQQAAVSEPQPADPDDWHTIRVKVTEGGVALEVLMDYQEQFKTAYTDWAGGRVGLITNGPAVCGFRQLTIDSYRSGVPSPAGDVLLH